MTRLAVVRYARQRLAPPLERRRHSWQRRTRLELSRADGRLRGGAGLRTVHLRPCRDPIYTVSRFSGALAQLGERRLCKPEVTGSIPVRSTIERPRKRGLSVSRTEDACGVIRAEKQRRSNIRG
jgi:hypothetical protein